MHSVRSCKDMDRIESIKGGKLVAFRLVNSIPAFGLVVFSACTPVALPEINEAQLIMLLKEGKVTDIGTPPRRWPYWEKGFSVVLTKEGEAYAYYGEALSLEILENPCEGCPPIGVLHID